MEALDQRNKSLFNLINQQPDIDKTYLYAKYPYKAKYQSLINNRERAGLKHFNDSKSFIEYSNDKDQFYENTEEYILNKESKTLMMIRFLICVVMKNLIQ